MHFEQYKRSGISSSAVWLDLKMINERLRQYNNWSLLSNKELTTKSFGTNYIHSILRHLLNKGTKFAHPLCESLLLPAIKADLEPWRERINEGFPSVFSIYSSIGSHSILMRLPAKLFIQRYCGVCGTPLRPSFRLGATSSGSVSAEFVDICSTCNISAMPTDISVPSSLSSYLLINNNKELTLTFMNFLREVYGDNAWLPIYSSLVFAVGSTTGFSDDIEAIAVNRATLEAHGGDIHKLMIQFGLEKETIAEEASRTYTPVEQPSGKKYVTIPTKKGKVISVEPVQSRPINIG